LQNDSLSPAACHHLPLQPSETDADLPEFFDLPQGDRPDTQKRYSKISKSTV
jgi:hypothetical protein